MENPSKIPSRIFGRIVPILFLVAFIIFTFSPKVRASCWSGCASGCGGPCSYSCQVLGNQAWEGGAGADPDSCASGCDATTCITLCDTPYEAKAVCGSGSGLAPYKAGCSITAPSSVNAGDTINFSVTGVPNSQNVLGDVSLSGQCGGQVGSCAPTNSCTSNANCSGNYSCNNGTCKPDGNCSGYTTAANNSAGTCTIKGTFSGWTGCVSDSQCPTGGTCQAGGICSETCSVGVAVNCTLSGTNTQIGIPTSPTERNTLNGTPTGNSSICGSLTTLTYAHYDNNNPLTIPTNGSVTAMCVKGVNTLNFPLTLKGKNGSTITISANATSGVGYTWQFGAPATGIYNVTAIANPPTVAYCSSQDDAPAQYFVCTNSTAPGSATNLAANGNTACPATKIPILPIISWSPPSSWGYFCPGPNNNTYSAQITDPSNGNAVVGSYSGPLTSFTPATALQYSHTYNYAVTTNNGALSGPTASCSFTTAAPIYFQSSGGNVTAFGALSDALPGSISLSLSNSTSSAGLVIGNPASSSLGIFSKGGVSPGWNLSPYVAHTPIPDLSYTTIRNNALNLAGIAPSSLSSYCAQNYNSKPNNFVSGNYHFWCLETGGAGIGLGSNLDDRLTKILAAPDNTRYHIILVDPTAPAISPPFVTNPTTGYTIDRKILVLLPNSLYVRKSTIVNNTSLTNGGNAALLFLIGNTTSSGDLLIDHGMGQVDGFYVFPGVYNDAYDQARTTKLQSDGALIGYGPNAFTAPNGFLSSYNTSGNPAEVEDYDPKYIELFRSFFGITKYSYNELPPQ